MMEWEECIHELERLEKKLERLESVLANQVDRDIQDRQKTYEKNIEKVESRLMTVKMEARKRVAMEQKSVV
ncbi:hypothetical protein [Fervidibacillus albus]|uniref:Uncharacterized protein n=1 Tax=Fervidibacillus albus TaxID=2980026 RepID=A0A9E8RYG0_9BACI|nr:hypothetical protein [Fervidibacillus albus]WAA10592.1 hypothetical protein OE104_04535 [Fervidibacillus albus]